MSYALQWVLSRKFVSSLMATILSLVFTQAGAQVKPPPAIHTDREEEISNAQIKRPVPVVDSNAISNDVEHPPEFPGGHSALLQYLSDNIKYPAAAKKGGIKGRVWVQFVINRQGKIIDLKIQRSLSPECDAEVLKALIA